MQSWLPPNENHMLHINFSRECYRETRSNENDGASEVSTNELPLLKKAESETHEFNEIALQLMFVSFIKWKLI